MMFKVFITLFLSAILSGCGLSDEKNDFMVLCTQYELLINIENYSELNSVERAAKLDSFLTKELHGKGDAYAAWSAIQYGPAEERYFLFKEAARSVGYADWNCPAIEKHGHEIGF